MHEPVLQMPAPGKEKTVLCPGTLGLSKRRRTTTTGISEEVKVMKNGLILGT